MYAVVGETAYPPHEQIRDRPEFQEFQDIHADQPGYKGTVIVHLGGGGHVTVTFWETSQDMERARQALSPVVARLLDPLMTAPSQLIGTGEVILSDLPLGEEQAR